MTDPKLPGADPKSTDQSHNATSVPHVCGGDADGDDSLGVIHDPNQSGTDQPLETIRQQTRDAPEAARAVDQRASAGPDDEL